MTTKGNKGQEQSIYKAQPFVGKYQGIGIRGNGGIRKGTFVDQKKKDLRTPKALPPLKFN